jgi:uncharacterized protein YPO0396
MRSATDVDTVLFSELPDPRLGQFRMHRLSVWNWGTFSKVHTVHIPEKGMLMLGPSGAGKSTLLDAISAILIPPTLVHFNAAAEGGATRTRDRSLMSYVRGAWADKGQENTNEIAKQFLRPDATASAIALEFRTRDHRHLTLVRVFWVTSSGANAHINRHFMVVDGPFDLLSELSKFGTDRRKLKAALNRPEIRHHDDIYSSYQEHWCRLMGIDGVAALELLHRTQSTKSLSDLNTFLREFMLAEPETFGVAARLVEEFSDLDQAHRAVVTAREQIELLSPAREQYAQREEALRQAGEFETLIAGVTPFRESVRVGLLEAELQTLATTVRRAEGEKASADTQLRGVDDELARLEHQYAKQGGSNLAAMRTQIADLASERERATRAQKRADLAATTLGLDPATDAASFAELVAQANKIINAAQSRGEAFVARDRGLAIAKSDLEREFKSVREEADALAKSSSNIPAPLQALRARLCEALRLPVAKVPFVGELVQVRADEQAWAGAAERLLRGFALSLLVDADDSKRVAKWVDETNLRERLIYYPATPNQNSPNREPKVNSILDKLEKKAHPYSAWLRRELLDRFDFVCVGSAAELGRDENRITAAGQMRSARGRTEKDDRFDLFDRSRWVLGFDSAEKYALYRNKAHELALQIASRDKELDALGEERQSDLVRERAAQTLTTIDWQDIDVASIAHRIHELEQKVTSLRAGNPSLADVEGQLAAARVRRKELERAWGTLEAEIKAAQQSAEAATLKLQSARVTAGALTPTLRDALIARAGPAWTPTLDTLVDSAHRLERGLRDEMHHHGQAAVRLEAAIIAVFADFLRRWQEEAAALQPLLASAPDFFAKLNRVEVDGLPAYEARFLELLRTQSSQRLAELNRHITLARREITTKLEDVNSALLTVRYNPDSYLQIKPNDLGLPEPAAFKTRLANAVANQYRQVSDPVEAERQFDVVRQLVMDLKSDEPEKRRWREAVLDVRRHVEFIAEELEVSTDRQIEVYSGGSGKSGGQRQKLAATCLAAALRYKLGGYDGGPPQYGAVVLDEAFNNTDPEFTATCMEVFTELGFQMIVATPTKSVMTLEEYVGGAVYVTISNRHTSALQHIEYDAEHARLVLSEDQRSADDDADA